eukprot:m.317133 g.317133  ORF g.317133 m.317133 type:complete len:92 (-) comp55469_c0_seq11:3764-4039(-)
MMLVVMTSSFYTNTTGERMYSPSRNLSGASNQPSLLGTVEVCCPAGAVVVAVAVADGVAVVVVVVAVACGGCVAVGLELAPSVGTLLGMLR